jgi:hypothetical protein
VTVEYFTNGAEYLALLLSPPFASVRSPSVGCPDDGTGFNGHGPAEIVTVDTNAGLSPATFAVLARS